MMEVKDDKVVFSSGKERYAHHGIIGINPPEKTDEWEIFEGYDGHFWSSWEPHNTYIMTDAQKLTKEDLTELADFQISLWEGFKKSLAALGLGIMLSHSAWAAPPADILSHDPAERAWVSHWHNAAGMMCCGIDSDCRPTKVRADAEAGSGFDAWIDKQTYGPSAPDDWVPAKKIAMGRPEGYFPQSWTFSDDNPTPRAWACWYSLEVWCVSVPSGI